MQLKILSGSFTIINFVIGVQWSHSVLDAPLQSAEYGFVATVKNKFFQAPNTVKFVNSHFHYFY